MHYIKTTPQWVVLSTVILLVVLIAHTALSADSTTNDDVAKQDKINARPEITEKWYDTTLVERTIGGATYKIPKNYIRRGSDNVNLDITVSFPDFQPLTRENSACFGSSNSEDDTRPEECTVLYITVRAFRPGEKNYIHIFDDADRQYPMHSGIEEGPYGFVTKSYLTDSQRVTMYRKNTKYHLLDIICSTPVKRPYRTGKDGRLIPTTRCEINPSELLDGNIARYGFPANLLEYAEAIDNNVVELVNWFSVPTPQ